SVLYTEINAHAENGPGKSEANQITKTVAENGLLVSTSSLSAAIDGNKTPDLGGTKDAGIKNGESNHENLTSSPVLENLTRDFATVNEEASMGSGSEGSTGMLPEELSQDSNQQGAKNNSTTGRGRRARAYTRQVRGRGSKESECCSFQAVPVCKAWPIYPFIVLYQEDKSVSVHQ
ncbi:hypothetical protein AKJ16_DCAP12485, partial [Drosera capensis]